MLTKLKAALAIGSIWGLASAAVGAILGGLIATTSFSNSVLGMALTAGTIGLVLGGGFSGLLAIMERRRSLDELTGRKAALWGFVAGAALAPAGILLVGRLTGLGIAATGLGVPFAAQMTAIATVAASFGAVAAGLAAATVSLAKADPHELHSGSDGPGPDLLAESREG